MVRVSIIIPTLNEVKYLPRLLASIQKQTLKDYEVLVADAGSTDKTTQIARKNGCKVINGGRPAVGRNAGAKAARGEYLLFLDADTILPEKFLESTLAEMSSRELDSASCYLTPQSNKRIDSILWGVSNLMVGIMQHTKKPIGIGVCIFSTRSLHDKMGGFCEELKIFEDGDYMHRAAKVGKYAVLKSSRALVSMRRFEAEGRLKLARLYVKLFLISLFKDMRTKKKDLDKCDYEFGKYT